MGRRKIHFEVPPADALTAEMARFLAWANTETGEPALVKAGLAHLWFVTLHPFDDGNGCSARAVSNAQSTLHVVLVKARFWQRWSGTPLNERQAEVLNRLLDGFDGKLTCSKCAAIAKWSPDTALCDITQLLELSVLNKSPGGGRGTGYELADQ